MSQINYAHTGPPVIVAEMALRENSKTTSDATRDPTTERTTVRIQN